MYSITYLYSIIKIYGDLGLSLAASLEPLPHQLNVSGSQHFYRYYFGKCSSELAQLVRFPYSWGRSTRYSDRLHDFPVIITKCYNHVFANSFFHLTARLWNFLPIECFPLSYDLARFISRINRHLSYIDSF